MPAEYRIGWYQPTSPVAFEAITDHTGWHPIEPYGIGYFPGCHSGTVESEPGYIRGLTLFGDEATTYGTPGNIMALPEPDGGLLAGLLLLLTLWRRRRGD